MDNEGSNNTNAKKLSKTVNVRDKDKVPKKNFKKKSLGNNNNNSNNSSQKPLAQLNAKKNKER